MNCSSGFALWKRSIEWSQGRTPSNAVSDEDIGYLEQEGYIEKSGFGGMALSAKGYLLDTNSALHFQPANEGYTGEAFE